MVRIPYLSRLLEIKEIQLEHEARKIMIAQANHVILDDIRDHIIDIKDKMKGGKRKYGTGN